MRISPQGYRLGRLPSKPENIVRRVQLARFFDHQRLLPTLPASFVPPANYVVPMHLNNQLGDCGPAACAHATEENGLISTGVEPTITDAQVQAFYFGITGGQDIGVDMEAMLNYWRQNSLGMTGGLIAYAALQQGNTDQLEAVIDVFEGAAVVGFTLPDRVVPQDGTNWLDIPWTGTDGAPDPSAGHCVTISGYQARGGPYFVDTWGDCRPRMDAGFYAKYADSPFLCLTPTLINAATQKSGENIDLPGLLADVAEITGATPPPSPPPVPPGPGPQPQPGSGCNPFGWLIHLYRGRR